MKKLLITVLILLFLLSCCGALASFQVDGPAAQAKGENALTLSQTVDPLSQKGTFVSSNLTQPGLECYVKGDFTWSPGQDVHCLNAKGGVTTLPEGWSLVDQDLTLRRGLFGWKETAVYHCVLKTAAGVTRDYTATLSVTKSGHVLEW